jgi:hypothetical protein
MVGAAVVLLMGMMLILTTLPTVMAVDPVPEMHVFFEEGAEEETYEEWDARWPRSDINTASGQDYWCRQMHEVHSGQRSIYCARNGINSHYLNNSGGDPRYQPWNVNITSLPASVPQTNYVLRYDTDMDAIMHKPITGARGYNNITMTFWFWSDTGRSDAKQPDTGEEVGYDFLNAIYYTGTGNNRVKHVIWTNTYEQATARTWIEVSVKVPNNTTEVGFEFVSGTIAPEGGDDDNAFAAERISVINGGMKEGVFLDDIRVVGTDPAPEMPLETSVDTLPAYESNRSFPVNIVDNGPRVGLKYAYLYYRVAGEEEWTKYTTADNPGGTFSLMPIIFTAPQDGVFEFFSVGVDQNDVVEAARNSADVSTTVDTASPTSSATIVGERSGDSYSGAVSVIINGSDATSGVDRILYRLDSGPWTEYEGDIGLATDGAHTIEHYAIDKAGNSESPKTVELTIVNGAYGIVFLDEGKSFPSGNVTLNFTLVMGSEVSRLEYSLDGGPFVEIEATASSLTLTGLGPGSHALVLRATDSQGGVVEDRMSFNVGSGPDTGGTIGDILGNPLVIVGLAAVALAAIIGLAWRARRWK